MAGRNEHSNEHCSGKAGDAFRLEKNIVLTGFMGSGKTSVGEQLARQLGLVFYDSDELISREEGTTISRIFEEHGETYFRRREAEVIARLSRQPPGTCVIATGGGAIMREENRRALKRNGLFVFLDVSAEEAYRRLAEKDDRPLLQVEDPLEAIEGLLAKRRPYYLQADIHIEAGTKPPERLAEEILAELAKISGP